MDRYCARHTRPIPTCTSSRNRTFPSGAWCAGTSTRFKHCRVDKRSASTNSLWRIHRGGCAALIHPTTGTSTKSNSNSISKVKQGGDERAAQTVQPVRLGTIEAVSYTHLTLPTIYSV